ncbi:hypothetical protein TWF481_001926 [Arthrobotrys musiformis]|uniref:Xylanolytic transcriptional activator regulatory domain-containing protein n=1 Tax=Arthrobotrys musiformis TaxID=47236 RepID=A0AAV9W0S6_9PEZI
MRAATGSSLRKTINLIQSKTSVEDMLAFIRNDGREFLPFRDISPDPVTTPLTLIANTYVETTGQTVPQQMELGIIDDTPFFDLDAAPWTTVTDDNELVSHLISSYATWDGNALHFFDMDIFLEGMEKRDHNFCSSILVNSILAMACHFSNRIAIRADPHNSNTLSYRFLQEAMMMWHSECDKPTLTNIQAGLVLSEVVSVDGLDELGWMLFKTSVDLLKRLLAEREHGRLEMSMAPSKAASQKSRTPSHPDIRDDYQYLYNEKVERAISATTWGTFRISCIYSIIYKTRPLMDIPTIPPPPVESIHAQSNPEPATARIPSTWRPYPYTQPSEQDRTGEGVQAFNNISTIIHLLCDLHTTESKVVKPLTMEQKIDLYQRTADWKEEIPDGLKIGESCAPFIATAHIVYCHLMIEIHTAPLTSSDEKEGEGETTSAELTAFLEMSKGLFLEAEATLYQILERFEEKFSLTMLPEPMLIGPVIATKMAMEGFMAAAATSTSSSNPEEVPGQTSTAAAAAAVSPSNNTATSGTPSDTTTTAGNTPATESSPIVAQETLTVTEKPSEPTGIQLKNASNYQKTINWLCILSEQYCTAKMFARVLQIHADKANIPLNDATRQKIHKLFETREAGRSQWMTEVMAMQTRMTLTLAPDEDNIGDVLQKLEKVSIE